MALARLLVANRGEVAIRVLRAATDLGIPTVAVHASDDADALHPQRADHVEPLAGAGPAAYRDADALLAAAARSGATALHPGYGFLSEDAAFAARCAAAGIHFVGPPPAVLAALGDKTRARRLAAECGVPVLEGRSAVTTRDQAHAFLDALGAGAAIVVKAVTGGGGRGMRLVHSAAELDAVWPRCVSEATTACGSGDLFVERLLPRARHIEVQVLGDRHGALVVLGDRDCSLQRRRQKIVEIAPAPDLPDATRAALHAAAVRLAHHVAYQSLGTFEFLVDADDPSAYWFLEGNPRLQVEHTVTEEVTGLDLVRLQLEVAAGRPLADLGLDPATPPRSRGSAVQARIHVERLARDGSLRPATGTITRYEPPTGPGVRVDGCAFTGWRLSPRYDPLVAKVIVSAPGDVRDAIARAERALGEMHVEGIATNLGFLRSLLRMDEVRCGAVTTTFIDAAIARIVDGAGPAAPEPAAPAAVDGRVAVHAPLAGTVVAVECAPDARVARGAPLVVLEAMKMEHVVAAPAGGVVCAIAVAPGATVAEGTLLVTLVETGTEDSVDDREPVTDLDAIRPELAHALARRRLGLDEARPEAIARRRRTAQRTARENVAALCDPDTFQEYGALAVALQRGRRSMDDLTRNTPADGLVCGVGHVNGDRFADARSRCAVLAYDYMVLAGTQGWQNHRKKDRLFEIAKRQRLPVVFFTEGGGGRPGDVDAPGVAGLDCRAFQLFGELSGLVPLIGINSGRCFAGNAALLGCCDVVIATANSSIGMGGPAMIEGGGLGVFHPDQVGPMAVQTRNGVVDVAVRDEDEAVAVAKTYLGYFQGALPDFACADQRRLRALIPESRVRIYDVRRVIDTLVDTGSALELRRDFGAGMVTALARVEGRPLGIVANHAGHLAGAIDPDGADKAARFMQLCDAFDLPILFLCDTPGFMVGPDVEAQAMVRHAGRLFVVGASLTVPFFTIVLRKGYGLGAQAMAGGSFHAPLFTVAWPTGEFGGMGLEGAVKLGFRKELEAIRDPAERQARFEAMVARAYEVGEAVNVASHFEIDDVIDPAESRARIVAALRAAPPPPPRAGKKRPCIDAW